MGKIRIAHHPREWTFCIRRVDNPPPARPQDPTHLVNQRYHLSFGEVFDDVVDLTGIEGAHRNRPLDRGDGVEEIPLSLPAGDEDSQARPFSEVVG